MFALGLILIVESGLTDFHNVLFSVTFFCKDFLMV